MVSRTGKAAVADDVRRLIPAAEIVRLDNGMTVCTVVDRRAPVATVALVYRAGARDEEPEHGGVAHFLEHMMFKGSPAYGPGEVDRWTRALGGSNNAYTSHDATVYHFTFAADRWQRALEIEADRMAALTLDPAEVESERKVILEEIAMYESEPWDALELAVVSSFYAEHPYGRPVLGTRESLARIDAEVLNDFHRRYYRPSNAVLVVAGDVGPETGARVAETFGHLGGSAPVRPSAAPARRGSVLQRVERRHGELPRWLLTLPAPAAADPEHPALLLLSAILGSGRSSRLHRALVDEGQRCVWVSADLAETLDAGALTVALEVVPGEDPEEVEAEVLRLIDELRREGPSEEEVARAKKILRADWIFGHERITQLAFLTGSAVALFDPGHTERYLGRLLATEVGELKSLARRWLRLDAGGTLGWSLPRKS